MSTHSLQWSSWLAGSPRVALCLVALLGACFALMRAIALLGPPQLQALLPLSFILMAATPWLVLSRAGMTQIGLCGTSGGAVYARAAIAGALLALICGVTGSLLFATGPQNWFLSIAHTFERSFDTSDKSTLVLFAIFTTPAVIFSPIGEELFFRALLQRSLEDVASRSTSTIVECSAFAFVHLCHHGLHHTPAGLGLWLPSSMVWMALMFLAAYLFAYFRHASGSVYPAVVSHMAFNASMSVYIFAALWGGRSEA